MKFKSRKDLLFGSIIIGVNVFLIGIIIFDFATKTNVIREYWLMFIILAVVAHLFWFYFGTRYELSNNQLIYRSGPFYGKLEINRITEIVKGKTLWVGIKPATARNGLIVKYDKYNEIYISPKTNESFIKKILELNSEIKITE